MCCCWAQRPNNSLININLRLSALWTETRQKNHHIDRRFVRNVCELDSFQTAHCPSGNRSAPNWTPSNNPIVIVQFKYSAPYPQAGTSHENFITLATVKEVRTIPHSSCKYWKVRRNVFTCELEQWKRRVEARDIHRDHWFIASCSDLGVSNCQATDIHDDSHRTDSARIVFLDDFQRIQARQSLLERWVRLGLVAPQMLVCSWLTK